MIVPARAVFVSHLSSKVLNVVSITIYESVTGNRITNSVPRFFIQSGIYFLYCVVITLIQKSRTGSYIQDVSKSS